MPLDKEPAVASGPINRALLPEAPSLGTRMQMQTLLSLSLEFRQAPPQVRAALALAVERGFFIVRVSEFPLEGRLITQLTKQGYDYLFMRGT